MEVAELVNYLRTNGMPMPNVTSVAIFGAMLTFCAVGTYVIPGKYEPGTLLKDGTRLQYKLNGLRLYLAAIATYVFASDLGPLKFFPATIIYDNYGPLLSTALLFAFFLSLVLYVKGVFFSKKAELKSTNPIMNFWLGPELNPHLLGINLKYFSYRPAFVLMELINISCMAQQLRVRGYITGPMIMFNFINVFYALDYFWVERFIVSTWDIIEENFGFMLVFGDYVWMSFVFSLQSVYLIDLPAYNMPQDLYTSIIPNLIIFLVGYTIFRGANMQKHYFREDPKRLVWGKPPVVIMTKSGRPLLCSGWWGIARKINYLGDILLAISMSMPCGVSKFLPWAYPSYLILLLIHRAYRDDHRCRSRYDVPGHMAWTEYCNRVKWVICPYIY